MPKTLWIRFISAIGLLLLCINTLWGLPISFRQFSVEQGLPNYSVISLTQDKAGFIWAGTTAGLCRYDGTRFRVYKHDSQKAGQLSGNHVHSLFTDTGGTLWVGTSTGLDRYDARQDLFKKVRINGNSPTGVFCIYEDSRSRIWVGSTNGLFRLGKTPGEKSVFFYAAENNKGIAGNLVKAIFEDSAGRIWVGTDNGLSLIEAITNNTFRFTNFTLESDGNDIKKEKTITAITQGADGQLWIGTQGNGIYSFNTGTSRFVHYQSLPAAGRPSLVNNNVRCITVDKDKNLWIGTQEGISIFNPLTKLFTSIVHKEADKESLSQNSVYSILQDKSGSVWIGTYFGGLNFMPAYTTQFSTIQNTDKPNSISNNVISSIIEDRQHNLWIGTEGGGLNYYNRTTGFFKWYRHSSGTPNSLGSNLVKVVYYDNDQNLWVGTHGGGLNLLTENGFKRFIMDSLKSADNEISSVLQDSDGVLWIATNTGMKFFKKQGANLIPVPNKVVLSGANAQYLYKDKQQQVWIACAAGLYVLRGHTLEEADKTITVNSFAEDEKGDLWMGTQNKGLVKYSRRDKRIILQGPPALQSYNIIGLLPDNKEGCFWLSTNRGLLHFSTSDNSFQVYTKTDGLAGNEFNYNSFHKGNDGRLYFGGFNGITHFVPDQIKKNEFPAPLVFTALKLDKNEIKINGTEKILKENIISAPNLTFAYDQNVFTLEFALLNYIKSEKNKYQYKLEDFDKNWKETSNGSATYTNLPSGTYKFLVKAANNDGLWSDPVSILIQVKPPFWLTWWAYCIYALIITAIVFIVARFFFLRALLKKEDELHQAKLQFFTNASHEIRTHLTLIMAPVERLLYENKKENFIQQQLTQVKANTHRLLSLVSELMDFRKAESNHLHLHPHRQNLIPFLQDIYESFREMSLSKNIRMSFVHDEDLVEVNFDEHQLEKVFFNLLANAFKFTEEGGQITLHVSSQNDRAVIIKVTDNGRGIAPQYQEKLFTNFFQVADHGLQNTGYGIGLALAKNIVELHKGSISVESVPAQNGNNGKTIFTVFLPKNASLPAAPKTTTPQQNSLPKAEPTSILTAPEKTPANEVLSGTPKYTLLIVEDNTELAQLIKETLAPQYHIITAENGLQGWEASTSEIPDLIISDVMMPEMDGFALCEKIRQDERTCHIPVILLTAKSAQSDQVAGLQQGADLYLTKPFSTKVLELNIQNLLAARQRIKQKLTKELVRVQITGAEKPESEEEILSNNLDKAFLEKVMLLINKHIDNPEFGVEMLSRKVAMSAPVLYKKLRALTNMSVNEFIKLQRFRKAAELLAQKRLTVNEVSFAVGYDDRKYFSREFKKYFGVLPSEFSAGSKEFNSQL